MITIFGSEGSMGKRYQAILKWLGKPICNIDIHSSPEDVVRAVNASHGIILATPTPSHLNLIQTLAPCRLPILCEKPLSKDLAELEILRGLVQKENLNLTMTMQYRELDSPRAKGDSFYNYFRHGNDGLAWDCLQIIGLARGMVEIDETSPVWKCKLNGQWLQFSAMDRAYVEFVKKWMERPGDDINRLIDIHHTVMEFKRAKGH